MKKYTETAVPLTQIVTSHNTYDYEALYLRAVNPQGIIVYIHGHNKHGAWELLLPAQRLLREGFSVLLPSQAGFGGSRAPRDYCGPDTVAATEKILKELMEQHPELQNLPLQAWGISRGATIAGKLLAGAHRDKFVGGVVQSGVYDHVKNYRDPNKPPEIIANIEAETGGAHEELVKRSVIFDAANIHAPVLILHGEKDQNVSVQQAYDLHAALQVTHNRSQLKVLPDGTHNISGPTNFRENVLPFLQSNLKA